MYARLEQCTAHPDISALGCALVVDWETQGDLHWRCLKSDVEELWQGVWAAGAHRVWWGHNVDGANLD